MRWERVTIFISSTFNDMHAERDYLVKDVFPELREWCEERKIHLVDVDLRWGVTEEDSSSNHTVLACLNNIDESRPFFLCFLGQRRGWVPGKGEVSPETLAEYPDVSDAIGRNSVTEMEIEHALLSPMKHIVNGNEKQEIPVRHALFYFRSFEYLSDLTSDQRKIYTNEAEDNIDLADSELNHFKDKIKNKWNYTVDYDCNWDKHIVSPELPEKMNQGRLTDFSADGKDLKDIIVAQLKEEIIKEFPDREKVEYASDLERDLDQQALFIELNSEGFISREGDFNDLNGYITNNKNGLFILTASAGSGKSMLLANFIIKESKKHTGRFFNRFCGVSDLCSQQYSLWKTIFDEAGIECPDTFKDLKDKIEDLLKELAKEKTVLIIDAVNQLPDGLDMLEWLPKQLPENLKIILSLKEDERNKELTGNISHSTVKPFKEKEEKKKLINDYLKKYLKALDDRQIDTICDFEGSKNPLYLKILLSELRIFGSFGQLSKEIQQFGATPKEAFNTVLNRLENDVNSLNVDSKAFVPLLFGLLANARNGLSEKEIISCMQKELGMDEEKLIQAVRLFIRQVRPFMARREGRTDYFYEAFKLAAKERYTYNNVHYNELLADYFKEQVDPEADLSFRGTSIRDFNELPYHLKESGNISDLEKILFTYLWIKNKSELSDIQNTINDYSYIDVENEGNYRIKLIRDTLVMSSHVLKENIKDNLPTQLWGRLKEIDNPKIKELLVEIDKYTDYPWLKPRHYMQSAEGALKVTLLGHTNYVNSVSFSPDGRFLASGSHDETVRILDWKTQKEIAVFSTLGASADWVRCVCFSPDGKYVAAGVGNGTIHVWDFGTQKKIVILCKHDRDVYTISFSPDGEYIISGGHDSTVRVWDWKNNKEIDRSQEYEGPAFMRFSPDGKFVATWSKDRTVRIWNWEKQKKLQELDGGGEMIVDVCFSPDGKYVATAYLYNIIKIWEWETQKEIQALKGYTQQLVCICFSPSGKHLASGSMDKMVKVWDWRSAEEMVILEGHSHFVTSVCFSPDEKYVVSGSRDNTVKVWNWNKKKKIQQELKHAYDVLDVCFSPDGKEIVSTGSFEKHVCVRNWESRTEVLKLETTVFKVCFSPDGKYFATGEGGSLKIWDWAKRCVICKLETGGLSACFSPDGKYIASMGWESDDLSAYFVTIWDWENRIEVQKIEGYKTGVLTVRFSPDGNFIAITSFPLDGSSGEISFLDWRNAKEIRKLGRFERGGLRAGFSFDGKYLAVNLPDKTVRVYYMKEGNEIQRFEGFEGTMVCFSSDDKYLVLSNDVTLMILDWKKRIHVIELNIEETLSVHAISNDFRQIAAGGMSGQILIYDIENLPTETAIVTALRDLDNHFSIRCRYCAEIFNIPENRSGTTINCPSCNEKLQVNDFTADPIIIGEKRQRADIAIIEKKAQELIGHTNTVKGMCFSPDEKYLVSVSNDNTVRVWDWEKQKEIQKIENHKKQIVNVCFSPDGKYIVSGDNYTIQVWDWENAKEVQKLKGRSCVFSHDGKYIASGAARVFGEDSNLVKVWEWREAKESQRLKGHVSSVDCVCFSPNGKYIASGSLDKTIRVWDWEAQKEIAKLEGNLGWVERVCFSPDGKYIVSGSGNAVKIWNWEENAEEILKLSGNCVCFSSDGKYFIVGSVDKTIRIWDWKNQIQIISLITKEAIHSCVFSNNNRQIIAGGVSGQILIYDFESLFDFTKDKLDIAVECPHCDKELQMNDFTADPIILEDEIPEVETGFSNVSGNTAWNIINGANAAIQGDWIYFCTGRNWLYKIKIDGSECVFLTKNIDGWSGRINVVDNWIYYHYDGPDGWGHCRIKTDGTAKEKLADDGYMMMVVGNNLVYCYNDLVKVDLQTGERKTLKASVIGFCIIDNKIFAYCERGGLILDLNGNELEELAWGNIYAISKNNNFYYYINDESGNKILAYHILHEDPSDRYLMKKPLDGGEAICIAICSTYNIVNDWIYFDNGSDGYCLYKMKTDGSGLTKLSEGACKRISIVGEWIYFIKDGFYRIKTDGTNEQNLEDLVANAK